MSASDVEERAVADLRFGSGTPATYWVALSTTTPADDGSNFTEPSGSAYARVSVTNNATNWPAATTVAGITSKSNGAAFTFPTPTGNWGTPTHWGLFVVSTGGTPVYTFPIATPSPIGATTTPVSFAAGAIVLTFD